MTKNYFTYCLWLAILAIGYLGYEAYKFIHVDYVPNMTDIRLFEDTPVWKLAKAVDAENVEDIKYYVGKNPEWLNFQEPYYEATLVFWSVANERYDSLKTLLELGADPNIRSYYGGSQTPIYMASCYSLVDTQAKKDPKYIKLLLQYKADPNQVYKIKGTYNDATEDGTSPLMHSVGCGLRKTKALVEGGADLTYKTKTMQTVLSQAMISISFNPSMVDLETAYYLLTLRRIDLNIPYYAESWATQEVPRKKYYLIDSLRTSIFSLDSEQYKIKMEIVKEFKRQGVDYFSTPIPEPTLAEIKKLYPDTWQEYIKKY